MTMTVCTFVRDVKRAWARARTPELRADPEVIVRVLVGGSCLTGGTIDVRAEGGAVVIQVENMEMEPIGPFVP